MTGALLFVQETVHYHQISYKMVMTNQDKLKAVEREVWKENSHRQLFFIPPK